MQKKAWHMIDASGIKIQNVLTSTILNTFARDEALLLLCTEM